MNLSELMNREEKKFEKEAGKLVSKDDMLYGLVIPALATAASESNRRILEGVIAEAEGMMIVHPEDFKCGGCTECEACLIYDGKKANAHNAAIDQIISTIKLAME